MSFDGSATQTSTFDLAAGSTEGPLVDIRFEVEATMAVPPWVQGRLVAEAGAVLAVRRGRPDGRGPLRAAVPLHWNDRGRRRDRAHLRGERTADPPPGCAGSPSSAVTSGRRRCSLAAGRSASIAYPARADGLPTFNEGFIFDGDDGLIPASVTEAAWLSTIEPLGEDVSFVLDTSASGCTSRARRFCRPTTSTTPTGPSPPSLLKEEQRDFPAVQQAGVRYRWDGEETFGMLERSAPVSKIEMSPT